MTLHGRAGSIERFAIPKSQGKQAYYDARKSHWGDAFPHPPKNKSIPKEARMPEKARPDRRRKDKSRDAKDRIPGAEQFADGLADFDVIIGEDGKMRVA